MMPATSFMGAELRRKRAGKGTKTGMSETQLKHFAGTKRKGLPKRARRQRIAQIRGGY